MAVRLTHGPYQRFRRRYGDITIRGQIDRVAFPIAGAFYTVNGGPRQALYVEQTSDAGTDWVHGYKATPAELRCREQGEFCVEIAVNNPALSAGENQVAIAFKDSSGREDTARMQFHWNPEPLPLPLDLRDLTRFRHVQEVGQVVNGAFDLDRDLNVIRSRSPVAPDALLVLGSAHGSQEATYAVRFLEPAGAKWLGCSDFFAGLVEGVPARGIRVGWCTAGMAALSPSDGARAFLAWGDHSGDEREWALATHPAKKIEVAKNALYRVRHQIALEDGCHRVRWRIWEADKGEPQDWLCDEESTQVPAELPRNKAASFALFQHLGQSIEWSDILVRAYEPDPGDRPCRDPGKGRRPFLQRNRPGAF
jgi:hypothetical protein